MADFNKSLDVLLSWEGGYSNNTRDPSGETYCGISRKNYPTWDGWKITETFQPIPWNYIIDDEGLNTLVFDFYKQSYWDKESYQLIEDQDVADKIFQHHVNMGNRAIKL